MLAQPKRVALLVLLALAGPGKARRDTLMALFWPGFSPERARQALRQSLYHLRRHLGKGVIVSHRGTDTVGLNAAQIRCDVVAFRAARAAGRLAEATRLFQGELLPGFVVADAAPELERWLEQERADVRVAAAETAERLAAATAITPPLVQPRRRWRAAAALLLHYVFGVP